MDPLVRRLRELDPTTFQELCFHLMKEKYPSAGIRYVQGASGDEGLDLFRGDLDCGPAVWQCKAFQALVIGSSQKKQIRESIRDAIASSSPRAIILCVNTDLDTKAHRWFQKLQASYASRGFGIDLVQGSDIIHELMFRHTLRDHYFPNASVLDEVRKLVPRPAALTEQELEQAPGETIKDYVTRLREKDPRFIYEISIGGDRGPDAFPPPPEPGIVAAYSDGRKTIKAFARDPEALLLDPPKFSVTLSRSGAEKMISAIRTGAAQHFDSDEVLDFAGDLPLQALAKPDPRKGGFDLRPASLRKRVPLRLTIEGGGEKVVYDFLEFGTTRIGTHEIEIRTLNKDLPLQLRFVFPTPAARSNAVQMNITRQFVGSDAIQAWKATRVYRILNGGCRIELFSLEAEQKLGVLDLPPTKLAIPARTAKWIEHLAKVSSFFKVPIRLPDPGAAKEEDFDSLRLLHAIATGEGLPLDPMEWEVVKSEENSETLPNALRVPVPTSYALVHQDPVFKLFGAEIRTGPCAMHFDKVEFKDPGRTLADFLKAEVGDVVGLTIKPLTPARIFQVPGGGAPAPPPPSAG